MMAAADALAGNAYEVLWLDIDAVPIATMPPFAAAERGLPRRPAYLYYRNTAAPRWLIEQHQPAWQPMFQFRRPSFHLSSYYEKVSIAFEFARARAWKRRHRGLDGAKNTRPTVGEMVPVVAKQQNPVAKAALLGPLGDLTS